MMCYNTQEDYVMTEGNIMKQEKNISRVIIILASIIVVVISILAIVFAVEVILNKNTENEYADLNDTDKDLIAELDRYLTNEDGTRKTFDKPIAFVKDNGLWRGRAYLFNVNITEHDLDYGMSGGTYAAEILLPAEYELPTMYRTCAFAPDLGTFLFPSDYDTQELCGMDVYVIAYDDDSLSSGAFTVLLDRVFGE